MNAIQEQKGCLLSAQDVANKLSCSLRHVLRLHASEKLPVAVRIGKLVRRDEKAINDWIASGCNRVVNNR